MVFARRDKKDLELPSFKKNPIESDNPCGVALLAYIVRNNDYHATGVAMPYLTYL